jgi:hypothetical protein
MDGSSTLEGSVIRTWRSAPSVLWRSNFSRRVTSFFRSPVLYQTSARERPGEMVTFPSDFLLTEPDFSTTCFLSNAKVSRRRTPSVWLSSFLLFFQHRLRVSYQLFWRSKLTFLPGGKHCTRCKRCQACSFGAHAFIRASVSGRLWGPA